MKVRDYLLIKLEKYLTEEGSKENFWEVYQGLTDATDGLRNAHRYIGKFDSKQKAQIEKLYVQVTKLTMSFVNKYGKEFNANKISGIRSL